MVEPEVVKQVQVGTVISPAQAMVWELQGQECDIRPRLVDNSSGTARLIDSGSQISVTKRLPGDKTDPSLRLIAVNGTKTIEFYVEF